MRTDINAPSTVQTIFGKDDRGTLRITLERRSDNLWFGTDGKTVHTVGTVFPTGGLYSKDSNIA
jgi:hypothetical protein